MASRSFERGRTEEQRPANLTLLNRFLTSKLESVPCCSSFGSQRIEIVVGKKG